jgi:hypothetical protein
VGSNPTLVDGDVEAVAVWVVDEDGTHGVVVVAHGVVASDSVAAVGGVDADGDNAVVVVVVVDASPVTPSWDDDDADAEDAEKDTPLFVVVVAVVVVVDWVQPYWSG